MSDTSLVAVLPTLLEISKIDVTAAGLEAQRKKIGADLVSRRQGVSQQESKRSSRAKFLEERRALIAREEKAIKLERDKLNDRRRALNTLNNYKLQQAAEREIDYTSKQLGQREDILLGIMREGDALEAEVTELDTGLTGLRDELAAFEKDAGELLTTLEGRLGEYAGERARLVADIPQGTVLALYDRIRSRYPLNPIVEIVNRDSCGGCHMKLGPQVVVQVARNEIVKCPGCGRILRLGEENA